MKKWIIFSIIISFSIQVIFSQEFDRGRIENSRNWLNADRGILLNENRINEYESIVELVFGNEIAKNKIYYTGFDYRGSGIFWVYKNGKKEIILETNVRYGPAIFWHNDNIAEIIIPTGSPFSHSFFYDFEDNQLSSAYPFPIYYDMDNKIVLIWGDEDFELYDSKTNELLRIYFSRRELGWTSFWPYIEYYIERLHSEIIFYYNDSNNNRGEIIFEL